MKLITMLHVHLEVMQLLFVQQMFNELFDVVTLRDSPCNMYVRPSQSPISDLAEISFTVSLISGYIYTRRTVRFPLHATFNAKSRVIDRILSNLISLRRVNIKIRDTKETLFRTSQEESSHDRGTLRQ